MIHAFTDYLLDLFYDSVKDEEIIMKQIEAIKLQYHRVKTEEDDRLREARKTFYNEGDRDTEEGQPPQWKGGTSEVLRGNESGLTGLPIKLCHHHDYQRQKLHTHTHTHIINP